MGVTSLEGMGNLTGLTELYLRQNSIADLGPLGGLTGLTTLELSDNAITDLTALEGLTSLSLVSLPFNPDLTDVQPLLANTGLGVGDTIDVRSTNVSCDDVAALLDKGPTVKSDCVFDPVQVTTTSLPAGIQNSLYARSLSASGGGGIYYWTIVSGSLPTGLSLATSGEITGTPTLEETQNLTVEAKSAGQAAQQALSIIVRAFDPSLVSYWPAEGDAVDVTGSNDGTLVNGAAFTGGVVGRAFSLDGVDDHILVRNNTNLRATSAGFTVHLWIRAKVNQFSGDTHYNILDKSHGLVTNSGWTIQGRTDTQSLGFIIGTDAGFVSIGLPDLLVRDDQWHHIAGTYDGAVMRTYFDGQEYSSGAVAGTPVWNTGDLFIGRFRAGGRHFNGLLDEIEIHSRAFTAAEIAAIFAAGDPPP